MLRGSVLSAHLALSGNPRSNFAVVTSRKAAPVRAEPKFVVEILTFQFVSDSHTSPPSVHPPSALTMADQSAIDNL